MPWPLETSRTEDRYLRLQRALADRYRLERELGRVGPIAAYQARALDRDLPVALKVIDPARTGLVGAARLLRDLRAAGRIEHPHLLPLLDSGVIGTDAGDAAFYAVPFLAGETLRARLDRELRLPVAEALAIAEDVAGALAAIHERGLAHGALGPESIVLAGGQAQVADLGVAAATLNDHPHPGDDIAALGRVLYEMLAGAPAPEDAAPPPLRAGRAGIPEEVELTVAQMLAPPPARYRSAEEARAGLRNAASAVRGVSLPGTATMEWLAASRRVPPRWTVFTFAVLGLLVLSLWLRYRAPGLAPPAPAPVRPRSVAVLPFLNATPDTSNRYLSEGLSRELVGAFGRIPGLRTADAGSTLWFRAPRMDPREAGRRLGVDAVLYGTVRPAEGRLRIRAHLLSVRDGFDLWAESYDRPIGRQAELETEIVRAVAGVLRFAAPAGAGPSTTPEAHAAYLRGLHDATTGAGTLATARFEEAVRLDSAFAPAWAALAGEYLRASRQDGVRPADAFRAAREAAGRALSLDSLSAEAHAALAEIRFRHDWDWEGADASYRRSLAINPSLAATHLGLAHLLLAVGRVDEAVEEGRRALELSPLDANVRLELGAQALRLGDYLRAEEEVERAAMLDPDAPGVDLLRGVVAATTGRYEAALAPLERAAVGSDEGRAMLGWVHALAGRREPAREAQAALLRDAAARYVSPYALAFLAEALGDRRAAFQALDRAADARAPELVDLRVDARMDRLRVDRRFDALARRIGLP
ncbi:MAG TPA: tetratricopeptide repeat protein [Gemmatimonadales bacterium]|nr:tetratricopeptide repeat protein [Gemmatimonadales bacterium]